MKKHHVVGWLTVILVVIFIIILVVWLLPREAAITKFTLEHPFLAPVILILWRTIGVVIPPIPAGVLSLALIPVIGWFATFFYSAIGLLIGASIAFLLARRYREPLVKRFVPLQELQEWERKLSDTRELWGFVLIRLATGPIMDFISYLAGLSSLSFGKFFLATVVSLFPSAFAYYIGGTTYTKLSEKSPYLAIGFFVTLGVLYFVYQKYKGYLKKGKRIKKH